MITRLLLLGAVGASAASFGGRMAPATPRAPRTVAGPTDVVAARSGAWSDPTTWRGGRLPRVDANVGIPAGVHVVLDTATPSLGTLTVAGELSFSDGGDRELTTRAIVVGGELSVGSAGHAFVHRATVTLTGEPADADHESAKGIWVLRGGRLELHGRARSTWTRLAATAEPGATSIVVDRAVDWRAGDTLVIAPSGYYEQEVETRVVRAASGASLQLDAPLAHRHWGRVLTVAGRAVDQRAEVGLLNRNVVVRGDARSEVTGFGGHVLVLAGGTAHVDAVELFRMGQRGRSSRYPFHWHLAGHVAGQSLTRSSVWRSYNRCVTIHGSHDATVADNVCYDHTGHGYFIEDGIETGNTLRGNLGVFSRAGTTIESDASASTFWVTNPDNALVDNAAAGSLGAGYWYAPPRHPTGPSATIAVSPFNVPLGRFDHNVAHSNRSDGVRVEGVHAMHDPDGGFEVDYRPRDPVTGKPAVATFSRLTTYMNTEVGFWSRGDHHAVVDLVAAGNRVGVQIADAGIESHAVVRDALVVGETALRSPVPNSSPHFGTHLYDGPVRLENVTFANYPASGGEPGAAIGPEWDSYGRIAAGNGGAGVRFLDATSFLFRASPTADGERQAVFRDDDGTSTGVRGGAVVVPQNPMLVDATCVARPAWHAYVCRTPVASLWLSGWDRGAGRFMAPARVTRDDGVSARYAGYQPYTLALNLLTGRTYTVRPDTPTPAGGVSFRWDALGAGRTLRVVVPWDLPPPVATMHSGRPLVLGASCAAALAARGTTTVAFDPATRRLCLSIVGEAGVEQDGVDVHP